jgi:hypothetical protein
MTKSGRTLAAAGAALILVGITGALGVGVLDAQPGGAPATPPGKPATPPAGTPSTPASGPAGAVTPDRIAKLVEGLRATPGCLGVEVAQALSRKQLIFAWFKDKGAAMAWYNAKVHQDAVDAVAPNRDKSRAPMADVPDEGPIMAVASFSPGGGGGGGGGALAIELYGPLKGGLHMPGGGFAPQAFTDLVEGGSGAPRAPGNADKK